MKYILKLLGYEIRNPSLLFMSMIRFTHSNWMEDLQAQNRLGDYTIKH